MALSPPFNPMSALRVLFYGTSSFAVPALEALVNDARFDVVCVVTQPDRPVGRKAELTPSPVKQCALSHNLPVKQFESVKDSSVYEELTTYQPDIAIVASFGQIMPERLLALPTHGSLNIHGSLLPAYRGSSPINAALLHGDQETGVTIIKMDAKMDHGPILATVSEPILSHDSASQLHDRLALLGGKVIGDIITDYVAGTLVPQPQIDEQATYVKLLTREDGELDWHQSATLLERKIRAYDPWPGTYTFFESQRLKVLAGHVIALPTELEQANPGTPFVYEQLPAMVCGEKTAFCLDRLQPEGKKPMEGKEFLRGKASWGKA